jgi:hypothetical protein
VLTGAAEVWSLVALSVLYGVGGGVVVSAEVGLVPQTVTPERLQQANALQGLGIALHLALWFTVFQREVPEHAQSRVSSYDVLGSFVLVPLGMAIVGPISAGIGIQETVWAAFAISLACQLAIIAVPSVWGIRTSEPEPAAA